MESITEEAISQLKSTFARVTISGPPQARKSTFMQLAAKALQDKFMVYSVYNKTNEYVIQPKLYL